MFNAYKTGNKKENSAGGAFLRQPFSIGKGFYRNHGEIHRKIQSYSVSVLYFRRTYKIRQICLIFTKSIAVDKDYIYECLPNVFFLFYPFVKPYFN